MTDRRQSCLEGCEHPEYEIAGFTINRSVLIKAQSRVKDVFRASELVRLRLHVVIETNWGLHISQAASKSTKLFRLIVLFTKKFGCIRTSKLSLSNVCMLLFYM